MVKSTLEKKSYENSAYSSSIPSSCTALKRLLKKRQKPLTFLILLVEGGRESLPCSSLEAVQVYTSVLRQNRDVPEVRKTLSIGCLKQSRAVGQRREEAVLGGSPWFGKESRLLSACSAPE